MAFTPFKWKNKGEGGERTPFSRQNLNAAEEAIVTGIGNGEIVLPSTVTNGLILAPTIVAFAATSVRDVEIIASSKAIKSPGGHFSVTMNGQFFYLFGGGPKLVAGTYPWEAHPVFGVFTYISPTEGTLSVSTTSEVKTGEIVIGPDATSALNTLVATGRAQIPANTDFILAGKVNVGVRQALKGDPRGKCRLFSVTSKENMVTSASVTGSIVSDISLYGNGFGSQPANTNPGEGKPPEWANAGCGLIFANVYRGRAEKVDSFFCGGDAVTSERNGVAGIWITQGCIETQVVDSTATYCRNGINEDNFFSGAEQNYNPLSNTYARNTTNYNRFGYAIDSGSLGRGATISDHVSRFNVQSGIDIKSTPYVTVTKPRCEFNGVGFTNAGIAIYGSSVSILSEHITISEPNCFANGTHGIVVRTHVEDWKIIGGTSARNFRHGIYCNEEANNGYISNVAVRDNGQGNDNPGEYDGVRITSCTRIDVLVNALDDQGTKTQNWGVRSDGAANEITINEASKFSGNLTGPLSILGSKSRVYSRTRAQLSGIAQGVKGEAFQIQGSEAKAFAFGAGSMRATLVGLFAGEPIENLFLDVTAAGTSVTLAKVGIWNTSGTLLASSADLHEVFIAGTGYKGGALSTRYIVPADGAYYVGAVMVGGTPPTVHGPSGGTASGNAIPPSAANAGKTDIGALTITASATAPWVGWS